MITVTLYGQTCQWADVRANGDHVGYINDGYIASEFSIPNNTRLLAVLAYEQNNNGAGLLIKLSNGFVTGSHWKCKHNPSGYWYELTYNDTGWPQAVVYDWPWSAQSLQPAQYISGELHGNSDRIYCRVWISKYIKHDD